MASLEKKAAKSENTGFDKKGSFIFEAIKTAIVALLIMLVLVLIAALILTFVDVSDLVKDIINQVLRAVSLIAAALISLKERKSGWLKGLAAGILFVALSFVVYSLIGDGFVFGMPLLVDLLTGTAMGIISGIIAVNVRK